MRTLGRIVVSGRPKQWVKNLVVFAALVFSQNLGNTEMLVQVAETFALFCLASAAVYLIIPDRFSSILSAAWEQFYRKQC